MSGRSAVAAPTVDLEEPVTFTLLEIRPTDGARWMSLPDLRDEDDGEVFRAKHLVISIRRGALETWERRCGMPAWRYVMIDGTAVCARCLLELLRPLRGP